MCAGLLTDILGYAPGVSILATSRERLNLHGEWVVELAGLQLALTGFAVRVPPGKLTSLAFRDLDFGLDGLALDLSL